MDAAKALIRQSGLDPMAFCKISNQCFIENDPKSMKGRLEAKREKDDAKKRETPFWYLGQNFFRATEAVAGELADWFDDPAILSEWLVSQQVKMIQEQPFVSSRFQIFLPRFLPKCTVVSQYDLTIISVQENLNYSRIDLFLLFLFLSFLIFFLFFLFRP